MRYEYSLVSIPASLLDDLTEVADSLGEILQIIAPVIGRPQWQILTRRPLRKERPYTDEELLALLRGLDSNDIEAAHGEADDALAATLRALGYEKSMDYYEKMSKWYA